MAKKISIQKNLEKVPEFNQNLNIVHCFKYINIQYLFLQVNILKFIRKVLIIKMNKKIQWVLSTVIMISI